MNLIIAAMLEEVLLYSKEAKLIEETPFLVYKKEDVYLIVSGIGKVNAASALTYMLSRYPSIQQIINIGFVGGYPPLKQGDIVKVEKTKYHDFDLQIFGYEHGQVPKMPTYYESNELLYSVLNYKPVLLYTGDKFLTTALETTSDYIVDMEGAAYYQVAHLFGKPMVSVKVVSDVIGSVDQVSSYKDFENKKHQLVYEVLKKILMED